MNIRFFKNKNGMTLLNVLVAIGLMAILSYLLMNLIGLMFGSTKRAQQKSDVVDITGTIRGILTAPAACTNSFATPPSINPSVNGAAVSQIKNATGVVIYQENGIYENNSIKITTIDITNYVPDGAGIPMGIADLQIGFQLLGTGVGVSDLSRTIKLRLELNATNNIIKCSAFGTNDNIWSQNPNGSIYYNGGNVGINTNTPTSTLDINGTINAAGAANFSSTATFGGMGIFNADVYSTAFYYSSDQTLKKNIHTTKGIETLEKLRGVEFEWKKDGKKDIGVLAQEVEKVLPELVTTDTNSGLKSVKLSNIVGVLIEATKDLHKENQLLKKRISDLEKKTKNK